MADGSLVSVGEFRVTATFGAGEANETMLNSAGETDIFIAGFNASTGELNWAKRIGGTDHESVAGVVVFSDGTFGISGGYTSISLTLGQGEPNQTTLNGFGGAAPDIFIARYFGY